MKMKIRAYQWVASITAVAVVTTLLVYRSSFGYRSYMPSPSSSSSSAQHFVGPVPSVKKQKTHAPHVGYTGLLDQKPLKMHCRTCALVTSSGQLIGGKRGEEIDQSECVIRTNNAPIVGYQQDVGNRTTLRIVAHSSLYRVLWRRQEMVVSSQNTVFIFWGPNSSMRRDGKGHIYNKLRLLKDQLPKLKVYMVTPIKMLKFDELFKNETGIDRRGSNSWLSTGWFSMVIAMEVCDQISVFGMVPPDFCRSSSRRSMPYHYYEPSGTNDCSLFLAHERSRRGRHRFIIEKRVFAKWAQTHDIRFYQPEWDPKAVVSMNSSSSSILAGP